jgi:hypothetical protein
MILNNTILRYFANFIDRPAGRSSVPTPADKKTMADSRFHHRSNEQGTIGSSSEFDLVRPADNRLILLAEAGQRLVFFDFQQADCRAARGAMDERHPAVGIFQTGIAHGKFGAAAFTACRRDGHRSSCSENINVKGRIRLYRRRCRGGGTSGSSRGQRRNTCHGPDSSPVPSFRFRSGDGRSSSPR